MDYFAEKLKQFEQKCGSGLTPMSVCEQTPEYCFTLNNTASNKHNAWTRRPILIDKFIKADGDNTCLVYQIIPADQQIHKTDGYILNYGDYMIHENYFCWDSKYKISEKQKYKNYKQYKLGSFNFSTTKKLDKI